VHVLVEVTTPKYKELFGGYPFALEFFQSAMMPYEAMVGCLSDPSICAQDEDNESSLLDAALQNSHGARDFRLGTQYMLHSLLTYHRRTSSGSRTRSLLGGVRQR
jgi:hypothetical protein